MKLWLAYGGTDQKLRSRLYTSEKPGLWFTWCNNREGEDKVVERLDRVLFWPDWLDSYPHTSAEVLSISSSDHAPIFVSTDKSIPTRRKPFRFEAMWMHEGACDLTVINAWNCCLLHSSILAMSTKMGRLKSDLQIWNKTSFENVQRHISELEKGLSQVQNRLLLKDHDPSSSALCEKELEIRVELERWYEREAIFWAQKSRQMWQLQGDRNTAYFHNVVRKRRAQNKIHRIRDHDGMWIEDYESLEREARRYFHGIFSSNNIVPDRNVEDWLQGISIPSISQASAEGLIKQVTLEEVKAAVFQLNPYKAPGPDGVPAVVFQRYWQLMQTDILNLVRDFLQGIVISKILTQLLSLSFPRLTYQKLSGIFDPLASVM